MTETNDSFNTILVAQDGSPAAQAAADLAIQVASSQDFKIQGVYVVDVALVTEKYSNYEAELGYFQTPENSEDLVDQFAAQGYQILERLEARCQAADVPVTVDVEFSGVTELILQRARSAHLLALGRRGCSHAAAVHHLGRHFQAVAHRTSIPMLVGGDKHPHALKHLLLAYHHRAHAREALIWAIRLQRALRARVDVLVVQEHEDDEAFDGKLQEIQSDLAQSGLEVHGFFSRRGEPAAEIVAAAGEKDADLIVMGRYRHVALLEWLAGSTVDQVLRDTPLPVIVA